MNLAAVSSMAYFFSLPRARRAARRCRAVPARRRRRCGDSDLMYSISATRFSSLTSPWNVGISGWKPSTIFACDVEDRLAEVAFVDDHGRAVLRARPVVPTMSVERRAAALCRRRGGR